MRQTLRTSRNRWLVHRAARRRDLLGAAASAAATKGCRAKIPYPDADATAGYPISYTAVTTASGAETDNKPITLTMEVTAFDRQTLPDSLFVVPDGYKEVKTLADLTATVKKAGNVRVGVVAVTTKLKEQLSLQELS